MFVDCRSFVSFSSEAGVKVESLRRPYIQRCRSFDNPHPPPSRYSRMSCIMPIRPQWGGVELSPLRFGIPYAFSPHYHIGTIISLSLAFFEVLLTCCFRRASVRRGGLFYTL